MAKDSYKNTLNAIEKAMDLEAPALPEVAAAPAEAAPAVETPEPQAEVQPDTTQEPTATEATESVNSSDDLDEPAEDDTSSSPSASPEGKRRGVSWKQRYRDLQSFNDKRFAEMQAQIAALTNKLVAPSAQTPSSEDLSGPYEDPEVEVAQRKAVRSTLEKDYGLDAATMAAIRLPAEVAKYRAKNPDSGRYDAVVTRVVEELAGSEPITEQHLTRALKIAQRAGEGFLSVIEAQAAAAKQTAPVRPEAATTKSQPVAPSAKTPLTPEVRAQLQNASRTLTPEHSVGLDGIPKVKGKNFQEKVKLALDEAMEKAG